MTYNRCFIIALVLIVTSCVNTNDKGDVLGRFINNSYPIGFDAQKAKYFSELNINYQNVKLRLNEGKLIPIECDEGITGVLIFSNGNIEHLNTNALTKNKYWVNRFLLFRFHPEHYATLFSNSEMMQKPDTTIEEEAWSVVKQNFDFAYSKGLEAIVPPIGSYGIISDNISIVFDAESSNNYVSLPVNSDF